MQCPNCEYQLEGDFKFCPSCGQETADHSKSFSALLRHFLGDYFTFDSKIFKSLSPVLLRPGFLTTEFLQGRRVRYIPPIRLYVFISLIFFLVIGWLSPEEPAQVQDNWDKYFGVYLPRLFFLLLPIFALLVWMLNRRSAHSYVLHFIFSLHYHSFLFLTGTIYLLITEVFERFGLYSLNLIIAILVFIWMLTYLFLALRRVYPARSGRIVLKYLLLLISYGLVLTTSVILTLLLLD